MLSKAFIGKVKLSPAIRQLYSPSPGIIRVTLANSLNRNIIIVICHDSATLQLPQNGINYTGGSYDEGTTLGSIVGIDYGIVHSNTYCAFKGISSISANLNLIGGHFNTPYRVAVFPYDNETDLNYDTTLYTLTTKDASYINTNYKSVTTMR